MLNKEKMFSNLAIRYDFFNNIISLGTHKIIKKIAVAKLNIKPNSKILDLCCGTGDLGYIAKKITPSSCIIGLDFSDKMLEIAKQKNPDIEYIKGNANNLSFKDNSFNYILIGFGLRNIDNKDKPLEEMYRTLKEDGKILHLDFCSEFIFKNLYDHFISIIVRLFTKETSPYQYLINSKNSFLSTKQLVTLFENKKFKIIHSQKLLFGAIAFQILKK